MKAAITTSLSEDRQNAGMWRLSSEDLARHLEADGEHGLAAEEARRRLVDQGLNELPESPPPSWLALFLSQFSSVIVWVLIGAAVVSGLLEDWLDTAAILAIVLLNGILGFVQEFRAEQSLAALRRLSIATARVIRDGVLLIIPAREVVPGDVILLEAGDRIPADARLVYTTNFHTQEASLTGESTPVEKGVQVINRAEVPLADRTNMVFMGTVAVSGKARALVTSTGLRTELGHIAAMIQKAAEAERSETPLQRRLEHFGYTLLWLALGVVSVVFFLGYLRGEPLMTMFLTSVSLAVAAVPEGLPAVVTITLALGVTRMVGRHALIRKLPAVETLGSATVICSDKTGTLTKNEMTVTKLFVGDKVFDVTGEGYEPVGDIRETHSDEEDRHASRVTRGQDSLRDSALSPQHSVLSAQDTVLTPGVRELLTAGVLCNGAILRQEEGGWQILGDPTEGALLVAAAKAGLRIEQLELAHAFLGEIPFDPERKMMTIVRRTPAGPVAYVKGAPDILLGHCTHRLAADGAIELLSDTVRAEVLDANARFAHKALRVLGIAERRLVREPDGFHSSVLEQQLVFLGLVAMKDPLRPEAKIAVRACHDAGIRTVMITGDHKDTATAIAEELGVLKGPEQALTGMELDRLSDDVLAKRVHEFAVYARVSAEHKLRIVKAWKSSGAIVAMTGDGVNDAPAVKAADIGVAMGVTGTDVTKEASDMVVTDDNFASIAAAVEEGRAVFDNIRKTIHFLLSCNVSEVLVMLFAALFGLPLPLMPIQILWMNLVTDGVPALALAVDPKAPDLMKRRPRNPEARLLDGGKLAAIGLEGLMLSAIALGAFAYSLYGFHQDVEQARTVAFTVLVVNQLVHALNCRSDRWSLFQVGIGTNRPLLLAVMLSLGIQAAMLTVPAAATLFKVAPLPPEDWVLMGATGILPFVIMEAVKWWRRSWSPTAVKL
jgi:Ca2+-transporting ATPase